MPELNKPRCSIIIPCYNEGSNLLKTISRLVEEVKIDFECLIVVDDEKDMSVKIFSQNFDEDKRFKLLVNDKGPGPANAIRYGMSKANSDVIVLTMADGSDDPSDIPKLVKLVERGLTIACASRYMAGGQQIGAPLVKSFLSRIAGVTLFYLARIGTHDSTNSFKAFDKTFLDRNTIESRLGFEISLELVAKAKRQSELIGEIPTIWIERELGYSKFKLFRWLPSYLKWYFVALKIWR